MPYATEALAGWYLATSTPFVECEEDAEHRQMLNDNTAESLTKERLTWVVTAIKWIKLLGGIAQLGRVPAALFIIDTGQEHIALVEAVSWHHYWYG